MKISYLSSSRYTHHTLSSCLKDLWSQSDPAVSHLGSGLSSAILLIHSGPALLAARSLFQRTDAVVGHPRPTAVPVLQGCNCLPIHKSCQYPFPDEALGNIFAFLKLAILLTLYFSFYLSPIFVFLHLLLRQFNTPFLQILYLYVLFDGLPLCVTHMLYIGSELIYLLCI